MTYNRLKILSKKEKAEIENKLKEQFGISEIKGELIQRGIERIFLYTGSLSESEIKDIEFSLPIERVGVYFGKIIPANGEIRLSIEGTQILGNQIKKNIFELNESNLDSWMKGHEIPTSEKEQEKLKGFVVMKYKGEFVGCGKSSQGRITNFIPKNRRLKEKNE